MKTRIFDWLLVLFGALWIFVIGVDYINKHPNYLVSFEHFKFTKLTLFVLSLSALLSLLQIKVPKLRRVISTGPFQVSVFLVFLIAIGLSYGKYAFKPEPSVAEIMSYVAMNARSLFFLIAISVSAYCYGVLLPFRILDHPIYRVAFGLLMLTMLLFTVAAFKFLNPISIIIILLASLLLSYKKIIQTAKGIFVKEWNIEGLNFFGGMCLSMLMFYIAVNFAYDQAPFPIGFDTRNFYMNISQQLAQNEGLIYGYRPYNWELVIAMGLSVFKSAAVSLSISLYGYILACYAMFHLGAKGFKLSSNKVLFGILAFTSAPAITNQLYIELKADMGLLFFQLVTISLFLKYVGTEGFKSLVRHDNLFSENKKRTTYGPVALIGLLIGFGLGIKMTNMFLLFSMVICLFWLINEDFVLTSAIVCLTMGLFLLVRLDDLSGVRNYHLGLDTLLVVLLGIGVALMAFSFFKHRKKLISSMMLVIVMGCFSIIPLSPWLVKNYNETRSLNPKNLLNGANPGPGLNFHVVHQNYVNSKG